MFLQATTLCAGVAALVTVVWFFSTVDSDVYLQAISCSEPKATLSAAVRFLSTVNVHMFLKARKL